MTSAPVRAGFRHSGLISLWLAGGNFFSRAVPVAAPLSRGEDERCARARSCRAAWPCARAAVRTADAPCYPCVAHMPMLFFSIAPSANVCHYRRGCAAWKHGNTVATGGPETRKHSNNTRWEGTETQKHSDGNTFSIEMIGTRDNAKTRATLARQRWQSEGTDLFSQKRYVIPQRLDISWCSW
jgi:hypothetical protein